ncbi:hypothetical protein G4Z16_28445 [Streptomyces bathyalis]|uniref:Uncharacterized protein n=1 Tax=Streptomyces bathyalis TaxID=2710756 RepID=A0A7T1TB32_9ACTN|nr:hypothetical protein [Streptomyces bathyalis]QPP09692.1 hypothetical protein G4Z16_28445 [Streptomyces bathyalis]
MVPHTTPAPSGAEVRRIHWIPGSDLLLARCFCGREREFDDPVQMWDWLLGHPEEDGRSAHDRLVPRRSEREHP